MGRNDPRVSWWVFSFRSWEHADTEYSLCFQSCSTWCRTGTLRCLGNRLHQPGHRGKGRICCLRCWADKSTGLLVSISLLREPRVKHGVGAKSSKSKSEGQDQGHVHACRRKRLICRTRKWRRDPSPSRHLAKTRRCIRLNNPRWSFLSSRTSLCRCRCKSRLRWVGIRGVLGVLGMVILIPDLRYLRPPPRSCPTRNRTDRHLKAVRG